MEEKRMTLKDLEESLKNVEIPTREETKAKVARMIHKRKKKIKIGRENIYSMDTDFAIMFIKYLEFYKKHTVTEINFPLDEMIDGFTKYLEHQEMFFDKHEDAEKFYNEEVEPKMMLFIKYFRYLWD